MKELPVQRPKNEERRESKPDKVIIGPFGRKLESKYIKGISKAHIEARLKEEGITKERYFQKYYFSASWGGREYPVILSKSSGDSGEAPIEIIHHKEGPAIYIDEDVPKKFWEVIIVHEITEDEEYGRGFQSRGLLSAEKMLAEKRRAHQAAITKEREYAQATLASADYGEYEKWQRQLRAGRVEY